MAFKKGFDPNRNTKGRPPTGQAQADWSRQVLEAKDRGGATRAMRILRKFATMAEEGSVPHGEFLFNRAYGKVKEVVETIGAPADDAAADFIAFIRANPGLKTAYLSFLKKRDSS